MDKLDSCLPPPAWLAAGMWWTWVSRFWWQAAHDVHPSRRAGLLPSWPASAWEHAGVLAQVSRQLAVADVAPADWYHARSTFRLALMPQAPLAELVRRLGLTLGGRPVSVDDVRFCHEQAPLFWRGATVPDADAEALGWTALNFLLAELPPAVRQQFQWKTPLLLAPVPTAIAAPVEVVRRILREFEEPWCYLCETSPAKFARRPPRDG